MPRVIGLLGEQQIDATAPQELTGASRPANLVRPGARPRQLDVEQHASEGRIARTSGHRTSRSGGGRANLLDEVLLLTHEVGLAHDAETREVAILQHEPEAPVVEFLDTLQLSQARPHRARQLELGAAELPCEQDIFDGQQLSIGEADAIAQRDHEGSAVRALFDALGQGQGDLASVRIGLHQGVVGVRKHRKRQRIDRRERVEVAGLGPDRHDVVVALRPRSGLVARLPRRHISGMGIQDPEPEQSHHGDHRSADQHRAHGLQVTRSSRGVLGHLERPSRAGFARHPIGGKSAPDLALAMTKMPIGG